MSTFDSQLKKMNSTVQSGQGIGGRSGRPICKHCNRPIATKEIRTTIGDSFHPEHFLCDSCGKALSTDAHYPNGGKYYCPKCWESQSPVCAKCGVAIVSGPKISAMGKIWHVEHFRCAACDRQLDETFAVHDGQPFCPEHAHGFGPLPTCTRCGKAINKGQYFNSSDGTKHWHAECFVCASCKMPFDSKGTHYELDGEVYCQLHYHMKKGSVCASCGLPIVGDALEANGAVWHTDCFKCATCQRSLKGVTFHLINGKPTCVDCTARLHPGATSR